MDAIYQQLKQFGKVKPNEPLAKHTTFKIGGPADYFVVARNIDELKEALQWSKDKQQKVCLLAGGSNLIFLDEGFRGLVIKPEFNKLEIIVDIHLLDCAVRVFIARVY